MKKIKIYILILLTGISLNSCLVDDDVAQNIETTPYIVGFAQATAVNSYFEDEGVVGKTYPVVLKGSPTGDNYSSDIVLSYTIDPSSTAVEGQEFDFVDTSGKLTMSANTDFALFPLNLNTGSFNPNGPTTLVINIESSTESVVVSSQYSQMTIKFVGCLATLQGSYSLSGIHTATDGSTSLYSNAAEEISAYGSTPNTFITSTTGHWAPGALAPGYDGFIFTVVCGEVFIDTQSLGGYWGNTVEGIAGDGNPTGTVDPDTGNVHIEYNVCYDGACRNYVSDYQLN